MKYASIILIHYSLVDDFGGVRAKREIKTRSEMLRETVDSIVKNTDYPAELIVIDNGGKPDDSNYLLDLTRNGTINTYIRHKDNMHWAFSYNLGAKVATGDYLCFTCNDVAVKPKWLSTCIGILEKYPDRKFVTSPIMVSHQEERFNFRTLDENRLNSMSGSNCMIMTRETFNRLGDFGVYVDFSNQWFINKSKIGYLTISPPEDLAEHLSPTGGVNWKRVIEVKKTLLNNKKIDFHDNLKETSNI